MVEDGEDWDGLQMTNFLLLLFVELPGDQVEDEDEDDNDNEVWQVNYLNVYNPHFLVVLSHVISIIFMNPSYFSVRQ